MNKKHINDNNFKADFPFFKNNPHLVYLDTAASSLKPQVVIDAIKEYYEQYCINPHSQDYQLAVKGNDIVEDTRKIISKFINSNENEVIFCPSATFAFNQIAFGLEKYLQENDEILLTNLEHSSLLLPFYRLIKTKKIKIKFIETNKQGIITIEKLKKVLTPKTRIVAFANINNSLAIENDTEKLTSFIKDYGQKHLKNNDGIFKNILVVIDGTQSAGHIKTDVKKWNIDFFGFSAHKVFGPTGIGILWGKNEWLNIIEPLILGGGMNDCIETNGKFSLLASPTRFEGGTQNIAGVFGLGAAIKYLLSIGMENIKNHQISLKKYAVKQLTKHLNDNIEIYNSNGNSNNIIFNINNVFAQDVANFLGTQNICVRSGTYCAKLLTNTINTTATIRVSLYIYNCKKDIDLLIMALKKGINEGGDFLNEFF